MIELLPAAGRALVVGGGAIAERKVRGLVEAGFAMTVVAPEVSEGIHKLPEVDIRDHAFTEGDIPGHAIIFACTNDRAVNRQAGAAARARGIPVAVADRQDESTFLTPAVLRDGDLTVAISTGGASPALAREVRDRVAAALGSGWAARIAEAREDRTARLAAGRVETTSRAS